MAKDTTGLITRSFRETLGSVLGAPPPVHPQSGIDEEECRRNPRPQDDVQPKISKAAQLAAADTEGTAPQRESEPGGPLT
ncbi:MAG: hypothetical protein H6861_08615 [Rhodospirillales bacterium]|nr:hypothetical protein [Rhodospirillales bacterium]